MTVPKLPAVSFADETAYDSDEFDNDTFSNASSSSSGVILGFYDGELTAVTTPEGQQQQHQASSEGVTYEDEEDLTISRIGGRSVSWQVDMALPTFEGALIRILFHSLMHAQNSTSHSKQANYLQ